MIKLLFDNYFDCFDYFNFFDFIFDFIFLIFFILFDIFVPVNLFLLNLRFYLILYLFYLNRIHENFYVSNTATGKYTQNVTHKFVEYTFIIYYVRLSGCSS